MSMRRFNFAEEPPEPQPTHFWVTRMVITGIIVGCAAAAHIIYGFRFF